MAMTGNTGPFVAFGPLADLPSTTTNITAALSGTQLPGPSIFYHGSGIPDPRFLFDQAKAGGFKGIAPSHLSHGTLYSIDGTPAARSATNIAAAANTVSGTAMTLVTAPSFGVVLNVPISPTTSTGNALGGVAVVTPKLCLDFGFALCTTTSGSANVTVADTTNFVVGMPIVVADTGSATTPWFTNVQSITSATVFVASSTAPFSATTGNGRIGTGNIWQPNEGTYTVPTAALPYLGSGPGLFLDPRQSISRGVYITCNNASGTGGAFVVSGYDIYGQAMSESITITPGSALTAYGKKAFKYVNSIVPGFTDATYTYSVGTSDVYGLALRSPEWELTEVYWNATAMTSSTGWVAGLALGTASTTTTADVRGTIQTSAQGGGSGIGSTVSNGSHSGTAFTGVRLVMGQKITVSDMLFATNLAPQTLYGNSQA